jgi:hypothetical protein
MYRNPKLVTKLVTRLLLVEILASHPKHVFDTLHAETLSVNNSHYAIQTYSTLSTWPWWHLEYVWQKKSANVNGILNFVQAWRQPTRLCVGAVPYPAADVVPQAHNSDSVASENTCRNLQFYKRHQLLMIFIVLRGYIYILQFLLKFSQFWNDPKNFIFSCREMLPVISCCLQN